MAGNDWKWLELAEHGWKWQKLLEMAEKRRRKKNDDAGKSNGMAL